ncbi:hypothetical protein [Halomonas heilongjiangensis]|uniref:hypothetical protein n=1 Tax=Halomonas heilongjiangensis TaxID=1387883 RepID=UPI0011AF04A9|nr:hypothetical protein [Halomonas heilongjiangensis]
MAHEPAITGEIKLMQTIRTVANRPEQSAHGVMEAKIFCVIEEGRMTKIRRIILTETTLQEPL